MQDFWTDSFGRLSGGSRNGLPLLSALSFEFEDGAPDALAGKHGFEAAITDLNTALLGYRQVLETRAPDFGSALGPQHEDTEVLAASDTVHNALEALGQGHLDRPLFPGRPAVPQGAV